MPLDMDDAETLRATKLRGTEVAGNLRATKFCLGINKSLAADVSFLASAKLFRFVLLVYFH